MSGFLPVAHDALAACCDDLDRFAVLDLYMRAHRRRWKPLRVTERSLVSKWHMGNRRVWSLLAELEAIGCARIAKGGRRTPTTIEIFDPTGVQQGDQQGDQHNGPHSDQHNKRGSSGRTANRAAQDAARRTAQDAAQDAATLDETREGEVETETENTPKPPRGAGWVSKALKSRPHAKRLGTAPEVSAALAHVLHCWRGDDLDSPPAKTTSTPILRLMDTIAEEHPGVTLRHVRDACVLIAEACVACPDPMFARDVRGEGSDLQDRSRAAGTVFRIAPKATGGASWVERYEAAKAWHLAGRPRGVHAITDRGHDPAYDDDERLSEADLAAVAELKELCG